jgi:hypothetical protein
MKHNLSLVEGEKKVARADEEPSGNSEKHHGAGEEGTRESIAVPVPMFLSQNPLHHLKRAAFIGGPQVLMFFLPWSSFS